MFTAYIQTLLHLGVHFSYQVAPFIQPWPSPVLMYTHFCANLLLGFMLVFGLYYRVVSWLFFLSATSLFLMEKALYINHFYLYCIMLFLFALLPANRGFSLDVRRKPEIAVSEVPAWNLYILLFQISVVYIYAGFAKLNTDWLQAQPLKLWLSAKDDHFLLGDLLTQDWYAYAMAYGGIAYDLLIVPFMLWKKTRKVAFGITVLFHATNALTFGVGTFPWFSIAATALFFPPYVFRKWLDKKLLPAGTHIFRYDRIKKLLYPLLIVFVIFQLSFPLRPYLYPGNASWTEEGHFFAWRMMLRTKQGDVQFVVNDAASEASENVILSEHLNQRQISKMTGHPDMMLQFAHYLKDYYVTEKGYASPQVGAECLVALNGRKPKYMLKFDTDLSAQKRSWRPYDWVIPLENQ